VAENAKYGLQYVLVLVYNPREFLENIWKFALIFVQLLVLAVVKGGARRGETKDANGQWGGKWNKLLERFPLLTRTYLCTTFVGVVGPSDIVVVETDTALSNDVLAKLVYLVDLFLLAGYFRRRRNWRCDCEWGGRERRY
jgi:hypothetical protein